MSRRDAVVATLIVVSLNWSAAPASGQTQSNAPTTPASQISVMESVTRRIGETISDVLAISPKSEGKAPADDSSRQAPPKENHAGFISSIKSFFKEFRPRSCPSAPRVPGSSWPARGEAAISFCQS